MYRRQSIPNRKTFRDLTGQTFGRWKILYYVGRHKLRTFWRCECSCGTIRDVSHGNLAGGHSSGCNKCRTYLGGYKNRTHGMTGSPEHMAWVTFKKRNQLVKEWHTFEKFFSVVGKRPEGMKLCRIDTQRMLGPDNWMWSTGIREVPKPIRRKLLAAKNRSNAIIDAREAGCPLQGIGDILGLTAERVRQIESRGRDWKPKVRGGPQKKTAERDKEIVKLLNDGLEPKEIAEIFGVAPTVISNRRVYLSEKGLVRSKKEETREYDDEIAKYSNDGYSTREIAEFLNLTVSKVSSRLRHLRAEGVVASKQEMIRRRDKKILKYYKQGLSLAEIAEIVWVVPETVLLRLQHLREEGKIRPKIRITKKKAKEKATKKTKAKSKPKRKTKAKKKQRIKRK